MSKIHIQKAEFANKIIKVLHQKSEGDITIYKDDVSKKVKSGFTYPGYQKLTEKDKAELLDIIYKQARSLHQEIVWARHNRRRIRQRDSDRIARGWKPKKRVSKAEYEKAKRVAA